MMTCHKCLQRSLAVDPFRKQLSIINAICNIRYEIERKVQNEDI
jgi:hypothetical protein